MLEEINSTEIPIDDFCNKHLHNKFKKTIFFHNKPSDPDNLVAVDIPILAEHLVDAAIYVR